MVSDDGNTMGPLNAPPVMMTDVAWPGTLMIASAPGCARIGPILHAPGVPDMRTIRSNSPSAPNRW